MEHVECTSVVFRINRYFIKFPNNQESFVNYKGKDPASLKSLDKFKVHVTKVVSMLVDILEKADDAGALQCLCQTIAKMPQHVGISIQQYKVYGLHFVMFCVFVCKIFCTLFPLIFVRI